MKKLNNPKQVFIGNLLNEILDITRQAKTYVENNDIENLEKIVKLRQNLILDLKNLSNENKLNTEDLRLFGIIDNESAVLMSMVEKMTEKVSHNLVSLYDAKQVVKYY